MYARHNFTPSEIPEAAVKGRFVPHIAPGTNASPKARHVGMARTEASAVTAGETAPNPRAAGTRPFPSRSPETYKPAPALVASTGEQQCETSVVTLGSSERGTATYAPETATRRLDDLGSVQDGLKMSTDGHPLSGVSTLAVERQTGIGVTFGRFQSETAASSFLRRLRPPLMVAAFGAVLGWANAPDGFTLSVTLASTLWCASLALFLCASTNMETLIEARHRRAGRNG